jgi:hypothetical protein
LPLDFIGFFETGFDGKRVKLYTPYQTITKMRSLEKRASHHKENKNDKAFL